MLQLCSENLQKKFHSTASSVFLDLAACCLFSSIFHCTSFCLCHTIFSLPLAYCPLPCLLLLIMPSPSLCAPQSTHLSRPSSNASSFMIPSTIFPVAIDLYGLCAPIVPLLLYCRIFSGRSVYIMFSLTMYPYVPHIGIADSTEATSLHLWAHERYY